MPAPTDGFPANAEAQAGDAKGLSQTALKRNCKGLKTNMGINLKEHVGTSKWMKAQDLIDDGKNPCIATINDVTEEAFEASQDRAAESKIAVTFTEFPKPLILNKTNLKTLIELFDDDTDEWVGERVTLTITKVNFQGKFVDSIVISKAPREKKAKDPFKDEA